MASRGGYAARKDLPANLGVGPKQSWASREAFLMSA